ncbi:NADH dehydrogenase [Streptomyces laurentii]|uniref:NADH dehydrogenase n=1 Tax=Streptomyces laurentii TaxID=39478 RepID=A0A160P390_STRLU|nr:NADH dehydrogenase [Streptomyces laurentii]
MTTENNTENRAETRVVVIGGGYAGVMAANRLTRDPRVRVDLVNPRPEFVDRVRLHQLAGGTHAATADYRELLAGRVRLVVGSVTRIDTAARELELAGTDAREGNGRTQDQDQGQGQGQGQGRKLAYDYLVYAVGSGSADPGVPGAAEFAYPLADLEETHRLRTVLDDTPDTRTVTVVGAGPTGIETAAELAEQGRRVTLAAGGELGPYLHPKGRRAVARRLAALGVTVLTGPGARVAAVSRESVTLADGRELPSAVTVWTVGFGVPDLAARSGLRTDALGRLLTDETLTSVDDDRIVAAGDSAAPSGLPLRMSCQAALPLGAHAADTVLHRIAGERATPIAMGFAGQCLSLGRRAGLFQVARKDDVARGIHLAGRPAASVKEYVCASIVKQLTREGQKPGSLTWEWLKDPKRAERLRARTGTATVPTAPTAPTAAHS